MFLRALCSPETGKPLLTHEMIAQAFGSADRRNIQNYVGEFTRCGEDFQAFLSRTNTKRERLFALIEEQVFQCPFLSPHEQYLALCDAHPDKRVCEPTCREYVRDSDGIALLKRVQRLGVGEEGGIAPTRYLQDILEADMLRNAKKKEIVELFPEAEVSSSTIRGARFEGLSCSSWQKKLLVVLLYACTLPQDLLAPLFGGGKTCIHNWIYEVCSEDLDWQILREIVCWSGRVSVDEKWVKIKGGYVVLCAVDAESGFPLLIDLYPTCDTVSWVVFFSRFKAMYGMPTLIQCDGSQALAAARNMVFSGVRYQLCQFHTLKNLMKRLRTHLTDPNVFTRCVRLAKHMFTNTSVSYSRKAAAKRLQKLAGPEVSAYIEGHILNPWRTLTLSLTTNASERFNRKIEKCFSARYGVPSEESAKVL